MPDYRRDYTEAAALCVRLAFNGLNKPNLSMLRAAQYCAWMHYIEDELDLVINGDPDAPEPQGILRAG